MSVNQTDEEAEREAKALMRNTRYYTAAKGSKFLIFRRNDPGVKSSFVAEAKDGRDLLKKIKKIQPH